MSTVLLEHEGELRSGEVIERPNRFVLEVQFESETARVFLGDPGALEVLSPGDTVLCSPVSDAERKTDFDAIAVKEADFYVSLRATLANRLFGLAIEKGCIPRFAEYSIIEQEPEFPTHGRGDFLLGHPEKHHDIYVEVKSCTHAEESVGKFPDRQTERGRRHLRTLIELVEEGLEAHLVFIAQRPDVESIQPFREVDSEFADLLGEADTAGVGIHALTIEFDPPQYLLNRPAIPVEISYS